MRHFWLCANNKLNLFIQKAIMAGTHNKISKDTIQVDSNVKDYGNQPYFVKKANKSKIFLDKNGFPKDLLQKRKAAI